MTFATKVSTCVDCATPIIGKQLRCAGCHDRYAVDLMDADEDDETLQRERSRPPLTVWQVLLAWFVTVQIIAATAAGIFLAARSC